MKIKNKLILSSLAVIAVAGGIVGGSTYALFTSNDNVNIAVTSGKVKISAALEYVGAKSLGATKDGETVSEHLTFTGDDAEFSGDYTWHDAEEDTTATNKTYKFENGGTVTLASGNVTLDRVSPGDHADFKLKIENTSNIITKYRVSYVVTTTDTNFTEKLAVSYDGVSIEGAGNKFAWEVLPVTTTEIEKSISVELPVNAGNAYQDKPATVTFTVEAVQGNAATNNDGSVVTKIGGKGYTSLKEAVADANNKTVTLVGDTNTTERVEVAEDNKVTIDLNGKELKYTGTTTLASGVILAHNGSELILEGNGKIVSSDNAYAAIAITKDGDDSTKVAKLTINGGYYEGKYYAIVGNGSRHNTEVVINGGTFVATDGTAIYHPHSGSLTINGGTFTGTDSAIELRAGNLTINGGTFTATSDAFNYEPNASGTTTAGAVIVVSQHTTLKDILVNINGGTFNGVKSVAVINPQNNATTNVTVNKASGITLENTYVASNVPSDWTVNL